MNVSAVAARPIAHPRSAAAEQPAAPAEPKDRASFGATLARGAAGVGGAALGYAGSQAVGVATNLTGGLMTEMTLACMPKMQLGEGTVNLVNNVFGLSVGLSSLAAVAAGVGAGAVVAYQAAAGAEKKDDALTVADFQGAKRNGAAAYMAELKEFGADLRVALGNVKTAESLGGAMKAGFDAGSALGTPVGGAAGKVQGLGWGIALGALASLPIAAALPPVASGPIMVAGALLGAGLGSKAGQPLGAFAGSLAGGTAGAVVAAGYHGIASLGK